MCMSRPFLSIVIPTYNRSSDLYNCLESLFSQIDGVIEDEIEIIVSDNASTDDTTAMIEKLKSCKNFSYYRNETNLGMDGNFYACYRYSKGDFLWIFSDDDLLRPNSLVAIFNLLKANRDCGVCYLNNLWTDNISEEELTPVSRLNEEIIYSSQEFISKVHYWITFLTSNIVNKSLIDGKIFPEENIGSLFVQLSWIVPAIFLSRKNIYVNEKVVVAKSNNSGGYRLFEVFGKNLNHVMGNLAKRKVVNNEIIRIINNKLLVEFFPPFVRQRGMSFKSENDFLVLLKMFWHYKSFWTVLFPVFVKKQKLLA